MPQYLFAYHGGQTPESEEEGKKAMDRWMAWFGAMGDAVMQPGAPLGLSKTVSGSGISDGGGSNPVSGYTVVSADTMDAACAMARGCPMVVDGSGSVEVAKVVEM